MSLGTALHVAQNSLANVSRRTQVVAGNVARADDPNHLRRDTAVRDGGRPGAVQVTRAAIDTQLVRSGLQARGETGSSATIETTLSQLSLDLHGPDGSRAPAAALGRLQDVLQTWSADPADGLLASATLDAARDVTTSLERSAQTLAVTRGTLDDRIDAGVADLNRHLADLADANADVVAATRGAISVDGEAHLEALDRRDAALREIATLVPVSTFEREDGDLVVLTRRGATLFETLPREVGRLPAPDGRVAIDGVPVPNDAEQPRGRLEALLHLRDSVLPQAQADLDGLAAELAATGTPPLFTSTAPDHAATFAIRAAFDPVQSGDMEALRDGPPAFADGLIGRLEGLGESRTRADDAISRLDGRVATARANATASARTAEVLENRRVQAGGVDIDAEMTRLLALERSYEASARLIAVADQMLNTLLAVVR